MASGLAAGILALPAGAVDSSFQVVTSQFDPEATAPHPRRHTLAVAVAADHPEGARICASYLHPQSRKPNRGRVSVALRVLRDGSAPRPAPVVTHDFRRLRVRDGVAVACVAFDEPLAAGDWLELDYEFRGRPAVRAAGGEAITIQGELSPP